MQESKEKEQAFPFPPPFGEVNMRYEIKEGMSLRDWFAGLAMNGMFASSPLDTKEYIVKNAYYVADLMLEERGSQGS